MPTPRCSAWELDETVPEGRRQCGRHFDPNFGSGCLDHPYGVGSSHAPLSTCNVHYTNNGILETA